MTTETWQDIKARWVKAYPEMQSTKDVLALCNAIEYLLAGERDNRSKPLETKTQLPTERQRCQWWHSKHKCWYFGMWHTDDQFAPGFFSGEEGAGYVSDGTATHWMPEPRAPEGEG